MTSTVASLEGETNRLTSTERAGRLGNIVGWVLGISIAALIVPILVTRRR